MPSENDNVSYGQNQIIKLKLCNWSLQGNSVSFEFFASPQNRRGHLKATKFGQCFNQISEFYSSFFQLSVCRHRDYRGLYFAACIDLMLNENEFTAVEYCC